MVRSQYAVPFEKGGQFHDNAPFATFGHGSLMGQVLMSGRSLKLRMGAAHHEMGWFFSATEGFLPSTSIMVVQTIYAPSADLQAPAQRPECWQRQRGKCRMEWI
jgi:hypothetical protein